MLSTLSPKVTLIPFPPVPAELKILLDESTPDTFTAFQLSVDNAVQL